MRRLTPVDIVMGRLDPEQTEAARSVNRRKAVLAGPGTGKTRVAAAALTLLAFQSGQPRLAVCLAFNRRAANRIRHCLDTDLGLGSVANLLAVRTVAELAQDFLNSCGARILGLRQELQLWDSRDSMRELTNLVGEQGEMQSSGMGALPEIAELYGRDPENQDIRALVKSSFSNWEDSIKRYHETRRDQQAFQEDELVSLAMEAINTNPKAALDWGAANSLHVVCDDMQNFKPRWWKFISSLVPTNGSITATIDPNQVVHQSKAAYEETWNAFAAQSPGRREHVLTINYRSTESLVELTNQLLLNTRLLQSAAQRPGQHSPLARRPTLVRVGGGVENLDEWIIHNIEWWFQRGCRYDEMACIARRRSTLVRLAQKCEAKGIPVRLASNNDCHEDGLGGQELTLSTIHAAQGREWRMVWVVDVNSEVMPGPIWDEDSTWLWREDRLFTVSATRAKESLYFCYSDGPNDGKMTVPAMYPRLDGLREHIDVL